ncbi:MAG: OmpA family protein [Desulfosarcina sp.]|nr:OmpA family protein [Desulfosarcina sp.]
MRRLILIGMIGVFALSGCAAPQTKTGKGAAYGAAGGAVAGAVLGQAIGGNTEATLLGAAAGAAVGAAAGAGVGHMIVSFDLDSDLVRPGLYNELDRIAQVLIKYPQTSILVEGHTDSTGSDTYNQQLSERRANSVKNLLVQRGVQVYRINTIGYGESRPVATNATPEGRQMNRRVEIRINPNAQG